MSTIPKQESTHALARIRDLLENERVSEARNVLHEALVNQPEDKELQCLRTVLAPPKVRRSGALDVDRTKDFQWLAENGAKHRGSWVAIYDGELASEATTLDELLERVRKLVLARAPLIHFIEQWMLRDLEGNSFATGCAVFADTDLTESSPKIYVRIHPRNLPAPVLAQLDTGAAWSVLNVEIARRIGVLDAQGEPLALSTRAGKVLGKLVRAPVSLVADAGESLDLDATFFVSADWRHGTFLGYSGLLEWIRFAVDPYRNLFYFGFNEGQ